MLTRVPIFSFVMTVMRRVCGSRDMETLLKDFRFQRVLRSLNQARKQVGAMQSRLQGLWNSLSANNDCLNDLIRKDSHHRHHLNATLTELEAEVHFIASFMRDLKKASE